MNELKVQKISITGFKNCLEKKEFVLKDYVLILGDNAQGKTTIGEAISWGFTGCDMWGNERATTRFINNTKPKVTEIDLEFTFNGEPHVLIRRKKGATNELYLDDKKAIGSDVVREFLVERDIFFTIFNPGYFAARTPKDAKEFLTDVLKPVPKEEIFKELGEYQTDLLIKNGFNPNTFMANLRDENKEIIEDSLYLQGVIEGQGEIEIPEGTSFDDTELKALKTEYDSKAFRITKTQEQQNLENWLMELKFSQSDIETPKFANIPELEHSKDKLLSECKSLRYELEHMKESIIECPKCHFKIDTNDIEKKRICGKLNKTGTEGKQVLLDTAKARAHNATLKNVYDKQFKEFTENKKSKIETLENEINVFNLKIQADIEANEIKRSDIQAKINVLQTKQNDAKLANMNRGNLIMQQEDSIEKIEEAKLTLDQHEKRKGVIKQLTDIAKQYNSIKIKKQTELIGKYLNKVELQFEKITKDGELKDYFRLLYEGREFNVLSNAEKIKAGLEISNLIMNVMEVKFPIFVDNAESITKFNKPDTQIILSKVVEDKKLEIV